MIVDVDDACGTSKPLSLASELIKRAPAICAGAGALTSNHRRSKMAAEILPTAHFFQDCVPVNLVE
jgi:hypothetical protein